MRGRAPSWPPSRHTSTSSRARMRPRSSRRSWPACRPTAPAPPRCGSSRRMGCIAFGNLGVADWPERLDATLVLAAESGERWEEALSRNDLAHLRMEQGDLAAAEDEIARAIAIATSQGDQRPLRPPGRRPHAGPGRRAAGRGAAGRGRDRARRGTGSRPASRSPRASAWSPRPTRRTSTASSATQTTGSTRPSVPGATAPSPVPEYAGGMPADARG
jgi:hypothetical protein